MAKGFCSLKMEIALDNSASSVIVTNPLDTISLTVTEDTNPTSKEITELSEVILLILI
jgi:hypothetical protein